MTVTASKIVPGHPWDHHPGWENMALDADNEEELTKAIANAEASFWQVWIRDDTGHPGAVLYRPIGANCLWNDNPAIRQPTSLPR